MSPWAAIGLIVVIAIVVFNYINLPDIEEMGKEDDEQP